MGNLSNYELRSYREVEGQPSCVSGYDVRHTAVSVMRCMIRNGPGSIMKLELVDTSDGSILIQAERIGDVLEVTENTLDHMILNDEVDHPPHYQGSIEAIACIEAMTESMTDGVAAYLKGSALKYLYRAGRKGDASTDIQKAIWYLNRLDKRLREKRNA